MPRGVYKRKGTKTGRKLIKAAKGAVREVRRRNKRGRPSDDSIPTMSRSELISSVRSTVVPREGLHGTMDSEGREHRIVVRKGDTLHITFA